MTEAISDYTWTGHLNKFTIVTTSICMEVGLCFNILMHTYNIFYMCKSLPVL